MRDGVDDVHYRPPMDGLGWLGQLGLQGCLVLGTPTEALLTELSALGAELRAAPTDIWANIFHLGTYAVRVNGQWCALVVRSGLPPAEKRSARERFAEGTDLITAIPAWMSLWPGAHPHTGSCRFKINDVVRPRGEVRYGRVQKVVPLASGYDVHVKIDGVLHQFDEESLELVEGDPLDPDFWIKGRPATAEEIAFTLTWTKLRHPLTDTLYSFASSKTVFRPYQFVPVLKLLGSSTGRLLIADEVGLGKTIEAGLIWSELEQRSSLDRVLVVAPASLTLKWKAEMQRRFDRTLDVLSAGDLQDFAHDLREGKEPRLHGVVSLQAMRGAKRALEALNEVNPQFDLVIVDEAHAMRNRGTSTYLLGQMLSDWSDYLIFLSATPLNLGQDDLFNLVNLLDEEDFADKAIFSSQLEPNESLNAIARQVASAAADTPRLMLSHLDAIERMQLGRAVALRPDFGELRKLLDRATPLSHAQRARAKRLTAELNTLSSVFTRTRKVDTPDKKAQREAVQVDVAWTDEEYAFYLGVQNAYMDRARRSSTPPGFAMQMPLRQATSCIPAMQQLIRENNPELLQEEMDDVDDELDQIESSYFSQIARLNRPIAVDSKFEALLDYLLIARDRGMRQAMIFSFFRRTLTYLESRLTEDFKVRVMTGKTSMAERQQIMEDFRAGNFELLLLSQVGSEGLDFEFCNVLVNYDLPWNPMQVEQRIGRLDRFGQQHEKIFIINMHVPGTIESDIFERLYTRIHVFTSSIGELEPILRDEFSSMTRDLLNPNLTAKERQNQVTRIAVAIEARAQEVERLGESHGLLSSIDQLKIDGMTESGPADGRFIGTSEVRRLLNRLFGRLGGSISEPDNDGICRMVGSLELGRRLGGGRINGRGSMYPVTQLAAMLRDQQVFRVTFDTDVASKYNVELLSSRHPLVTLAIDEFGGESLTLHRYGATRVPGLLPGRKYVARIDLATSTGVRPRLELWVTAVDLATGEPNDEAGSAMLTALAEGTLADYTSEFTAPPVERIAELDAICSERRRTANVQRSQENGALVDARIESRRRSLRLKIERIDRTLAEMPAHSRDASIVRLHEGRRRNLLADAQATFDELEAKKELSLSLTPVAIMVLEGS